MSTPKATLYDLLGLSAKAETAHIREAFAELNALHAAGKLAPEHGLDAETRFSLIKDAYFTLSDLKRRAAYDASLLGKDSGSAIPLSDPIYDGEASRKLGAIIKITALAIVLGLVALVWQSYSAQQKLQAKIKLEQIQAERAATEQQTELLRQQDERQRQYAARRQQAQEEAEKRQQAYETKRAWAEAESNARNLERLAEQREREETLKQSRNSRSQLREAETAAAREKAAADQRARQDAAKARQIDYEYERRRQAGVIQR